MGSEAADEFVQLNACILEYYLEDIFVLVSCIRFIFLISIFGLRI